MDYSFPRPYIARCGQIEDEAGRVLVQVNPDLRLSAADCQRLTAAIMALPALTDLARLLHGYGLSKHSEVPDEILSAVLRAVGALANPTAGMCEAVCRCDGDDDGLTTEQVATLAAARAADDWVSFDLTEGDAAYLVDHPVPPLSPINPEGRTLAQVWADTRARNAEIVRMLENNDAR